MLGFERTQSYDRARILEAAGRARARNKRRRAITLYRRVLAVERHNGELHAHLAPLLAEAGQAFDAWLSFQSAARSYRRAGRVDQALAVYRDAAQKLPCEVQVWQTLARFHLERGQQRKAVETLVEGASRFRSRRHRPEAIHLLRSAHQISPWEFEAVLALSRLLAKSDQVEEARRLLEGLETRSKGERLRRVYAAQFRTDGGLRHAWNWLRCALKPAVEASYG